jgi:hypothetical protein
VEESVLIEYGSRDEKGWYVFFTEKESAGRAMRVVRMRVGTLESVEGMEVREPGVGNRKVSWNFLWFGLLPHLN